MIEKMYKIINNHEEWLLMCEDEVRQLYYDLEKEFECKTDNSCDCRSSKHLKYTNEKDIPF